MPTEHYVLDTTVIINLACVPEPPRKKIVAVLEQCAWVALEVDEELIQGVKSQNQYPNARRAREIGLLLQQGPEDDIALIERGDELREEISKPSDPPTKHLGEAGSSALAERLDAALVTDDGSGRDLQRLTGVPLFNTAGLLRELVQRELVDCAEARQAYAAMIDADRVDPTEVLC